MRQPLTFLPGLPVTVPSAFKTAPFTALISADPNVAGGATASCSAAGVREEPTLTGSFLVFVTSFFLGAAAFLVTRPVSVFLVRGLEVLALAVDVFLVVRFRGGLTGSSTLSKMRGFVIPSEPRVAAIVEQLRVEMLRAKSRVSAMLEHVDGRSGCGSASHTTERNNKGVICARVLAVSDKDYHEELKRILTLQLGRLYWLAGI